MKGQGTVEARSQQIIFVQIALIALNCFDYQDEYSYEFGGCVEVNMGERSGNTLNEFWLLK